MAGLNLHLLAGAKIAYWMERERHGRIAQKPPRRSEVTTEVGYIFYSLETSRSSGAGRIETLHLHPFTTNTGNHKTHNLVAFLNYFDRRTGGATRCGTVVMGNGARSGT